MQFSLDLSAFPKQYHIFPIETRDFMLVEVEGDEH